MKYDFTFYLGTDRSNWVWKGPETGPIFLAYHVLGARKTPFPRGRTRFALDSGAYMQLAKHGRWTVGAREYAERVCQINAETGVMEWAAIQDWLCDPGSLAATGLDVLEHQKRTVTSWIALTKIAPQIRWVPVLQGWAPDDYMRHLQMYGDSGTDLRDVPLVGLGSIARRQQDDEVVEILERVSAEGVSLHGFGVKTGGLRRSLPFLKSSDSMAWSWIGRMRGDDPSARHSREYAESYRREVLDLIAETERHVSFVQSEGVLGMFGEET